MSKKFYGEEKNIKNAAKKINAIFPSTDPKKDVAVYSSDTLTIRDQYISNFQFKTADSKIKEIADDYALIS